MKKLKTFTITTFGCRVNQAESRMIGEKMARWGYQQVKTLKKASLVIINTCCVTGKAEREVRKEIRRIKRENPACFLIVCGCWVNKIDKLQLTDKSLKIDLLLKNQEKNKISKILAGFSADKNINKSSKNTYCDKYFPFKKAIINIQTGCDKFCTYCIVPWVRGRSKSRTVEEIIKEINIQVKSGIEEVILTGIDIQDYKFKSKKIKLDSNKNQLAGLINKILTETKIKKISFGSMGISLFDQEYIQLYKDGVKNRLTNHFHIPLQSGCDQTLKRMGRKYLVSEFLKTLKVLKAKLPELTFATDILVGFPGETDDEFRKTINTIKEIKKILGPKFKKAHVFRYSKHLGTIAALKEDKWGRVDEKTKTKRAAKIRHLTYYSSTS
ncbi:MiaB/RimO family radical SAM methylthiotransferase [Patescibacteria group bacterium]